MTRDSVSLTVTALLAFASYSAAFYPSALKIVSQVSPNVWCMAKFICPHLGFASLGV
jgi:hypothetical protein